MLRFKKRQENQRLLSDFGFFGILGIGLFLFSSLEAGASARSKHKAMAQCLAITKNEDLEKIKFQGLRKREIKPQDLEVNIQKYCAYNAAYTALASGTKYNLFEPSAKHPKLQLPGQTEVKLEKPGVCESIYEAIFLVNKELLAFKMKTCEESTSITEDVNKCLGSEVNTQECVDKLDTAAKELEDHVKDTKDAKLAFANFFKTVKAPVAEILTKYQEDAAYLYSLEPQMLARPTSTRPDGHAIDAASFGAKNLEQYFLWIGRNGIISNFAPKNTAKYKRLEGAELTNEQLDALTAIETYSRSIEIALGEKVGSAFHLASISSFREQIEKIKARMPGKTDIGDLMTKGAPALSSATSFLGKPGVAAGASGLAGAGTIAALGAGAALGSQVTAARSSTPLGEALPGQQTPSPIAPLEKTKITDTNEVSGNSPAPNNAFGGTKNGEGAKTETAGANGSVFGASPAVFSSGASFKQSGVKPRTVKPSAAADGNLGSGGKSDDALKPFGGELLTGPAPRKVDSGGDVSSLLGQMKDLFNFDDGGMPSGPEAYPDLGANNPMGDGEGDPALPGDPFAAGTDEGEDSGRHFASREDEIIGEPTQSARAYLGGIETPLFKRVKSRHKRCMEKGLVVLGLGKLPE